MELSPLCRYVTPTSEEGVLERNPDHTGLCVDSTVGKLSYKRQIKRNRTQTIDKLC